MTWHTARMANTPRNPLAVKDFARSMKVVAKRKPNATPKDIELWAHSTYGVRLGEETLRKAQRGDVDPTAVKAEVLVALAAYYEVDPEALGRFASERIATLRTLVGVGAQGPDTPGGLGNARSTWNERDAEVLKIRPALPTPSAERRAA